MRPPDDDALQHGLQSQVNWIQSLKESDPRIAPVIHEYPLYSDAHITGDFSEGLGPYSFLNTVPGFEKPGVINAPIILRTAIHLTQQLPDMSETDESRYHGGHLADELAALTSVALGVRIRAGDISRSFERNNDPYGRPSEWKTKPKPLIHLRPNRLMLPSVVGKHSMEQLGSLKSIVKIEPARYVNLVRACRYYQDALWLSESQPNLAWLMFVSAIETAANDYSATDTPEERLKGSKPDLGKYLETVGGTAHVRKVSEMIAPMLGATKKFIDFTLRFKPDEPDQRPVDNRLQVKWSKTSLRKVLVKVYEYRSRALHDGLPFPAPMLEPPVRFDINSPVSEVPFMGLASHSYGGTWVPKDAPVNLHCFHYITRNVLLNWWQRELV